VIAENLSTAVVTDLQTLVKSMKDDRRKVSWGWGTCARRKEQVEL
jgi:hypothetical protein